MYPYLGTYKGNKFWIHPERMKENIIDIEEIAHSLSMQCRFAGHTKEFYSVAEHSVLVSHLIIDKYKLHGFLHDATETYISDIPSPVKEGLLGIVALERKIKKLIYEKYNLSFYADLDKEIKLADLKALRIEAKQLITFNSWANDLPKHDESLELNCYSPKQAKLLFLDRFSELMIERKKNEI